MSSPADEKEQYSFPAFAPDTPSQNQLEPQTTDEEGTLRDSTLEGGIDHNRLRVTTSYVNGPDHLHRNLHNGSLKSPSAQRMQSRRLEDDLEMLRAERMASNTEKTQQESLARSRSMGQSRSRNATEPVDDFDIGTTPIHEKTKLYQPPANPTTKVAKFFKTVHDSSFLVRYFVYITPVTVILLIPLLFGLLLFKTANVGGVRLFWFGVWLEIVWLTLWAARIISKCIPWPMGLIASLFTNNSKKWRDLGKALEVPATLFFWALAIEISFYPTMKNHHIDGNKASRPWEVTVNKIIVSIFVGLILNFFEKIIIQLIAISFHLRTYADRIEVNKFQIQSLVKLYIYSKEKIAMEDSEFEDQPTGPPSGARTPKAYVEKAQRNARHVFNRVGDVAGKVAGDFTGRQVVTSDHPHQVILQLLNSTSGSQVLARRLYRTFAHEDSETVYSDDLRLAFDNDDEASAAFAMFDKDLNGDISMEELEAVCVEIGRERKAITASLKDLDSVVSKLDSVFVFVVVVITILVFISLISASASGVLTSAGSTILALSWLFSATAQEFLQSIIFVFVKHPFDVGDRVTIYGNTGSQMKGDDYFVKEISLLFTEFKKMEGHVVQAPNSYLNTLFILNQRRSGGLAEAVPVTVKFGTTLEQIDTLRERLLEFVASENREYQKNILTELTTIYEAYSITLNVVFFYKSNWQNELLRLQRRNKFICAMMVTMNELGIEGPRMRLAGAAEEFPMYLQNAYDHSRSGPSNVSQPPHPDPQSTSIIDGEPLLPTSPSQTQAQQPPITHQPSILSHRRPSTSSSHRYNPRNRNESISQLSRRVDFSLGMSAISSGADFGDVYDKPKPRLPTITQSSTSPARNSHSRGRGSEDGESMNRVGSRDAVGGGRLDRTTSSTSASLRQGHRNRFFSGMVRGRSKFSNSVGGGVSGNGASDEVNLHDLEAGVGGMRPSFTASDMPDIPEASGANSPNAKGRDEQAGEGEGRGMEEGARTGHSKSTKARRWRRGTAGEVPSTAAAAAAAAASASANVDESGGGQSRNDPRAGVGSAAAAVRDGETALQMGELPRLRGMGMGEGGGGGEGQRPLRKAMTEKIRG